MTNLLTTGMERGIQGISPWHMLLLLLIMVSAPIVAYAVLFLSDRSERTRVWAWLTRMHWHHPPLRINHRGSHV